MPAAETNVPEPPPQDDLSLVQRLLKPRTLVSFALSIAIIFFVFTRLNINLAEIWEDILRADKLLLLCGFVVYYLGFPLRAIRWRLLLRNVDRGEEPTNLPGIPRLSEILLISWFVNCVVPAKMGDVYRAYLLRQEANVSLARTGGTVLAERVIDLLILFGMLLASAVIIVSRLPADRASVTENILLIGAIMAAVLVIGLIGLYLFGGRLSRFLPGRLERIFSSFRHGIIHSFRPRQLPLVTFLTVCIWLTEAGRLFFVTRSLAGEFDFNIGLSVIVFAALANSLLTAVPATPGGLGFVEAGLIGIFALVGVDPRAGAAITILDRTISYWSLIAVGFVMYLLNIGRSRVPR